VRWCGLRQAELRLHTVSPDDAPLLALRLDLTPVEARVNSNQHAVDDRG